MIVIVLIGSSVIFINPELFQGQILDGPEATTPTENVQENTEQVEQESPKPDLIPDMQISIPENPQNDIEVSATIRNVGQGALTGGVPFIYGIYMNGALVFSNTDSYTTMEPGDEFSFSYPISRSIYPDDSGTITFKVDVENSISETSEDNNEVVKEFSF